MQPPPTSFLIVDDHPLLRIGIRTTLLARYVEARIDEAGDAEEALSKFDSCRPDLVLLDIQLPGINGLDLARRLLARDRDLKILMVAPEADPWTIDEALRAGASGFLSKTNAPDILPGAIETVTAGQVFLCPEATRAVARAQGRKPEPPEAPGPAILTQREREVLSGLVHGDTNKAVAARLGISPKTVETHRSHIAVKLRTSSVADLTRYAIRHGLTQA